MNVEQARRLVERSRSAQNTASQSGQGALHEDRSHLEVKWQLAAMRQADSSE